MTLEQRIEEFVDRVLVQWAVADSKVSVLRANVKELAATVRHEALEEAAKVCEAFTPKVVETNSASELIAATAHQIREKILALKDRP